MIPSDTKIKWSFGANSREENKFLNLDDLAGPNTWIIKVIRGRFQSVRFLTPTKLSNFPSDTKIMKRQALSWFVCFVFFLVKVALLFLRYKIPEKRGFLDFFGTPTSCLVKKWVVALSLYSSFGLYLVYIQSIELFDFSLL